MDPVSTTVFEESVRVKVNVAERNLFKVCFFNLFTVKKNVVKVPVGAVTN